MTIRGGKEIKKTVIVAGKENGEIDSVTFELLRVGRKLSEKAGGTLCTVVLGHEVGDASHELAHYSDEVHVVDNPLLSSFQGDLYAHVLEELFRNIEPDIVLMGHTLDNLDLAPRLAFKLGTRLITDCIDFDIEPESGYLLCMKPVYGDNAVGTFIQDNKPMMGTLRPKTMEAMVRGPANGNVITFAPTIDRALSKIEILDIVPSEGVSLDKADAIVAGGRGIRRVEGLKELYELIEVLKGYFDKVELGASRPVIDSGWLPPSRQLGLTGEKASPQLYIAVGISGASQHLSGILGSKKIVAINNDEHAAIFHSADYGVVGEYEDVLPAFIKKTLELKKGRELL